MDDMCTGRNGGKRKWASRGDVELFCGSHFCFQCLYVDPMLFGAKVMDVVLWARGKSLLLQNTWNLCVFLSWTNSEFAVPITLGNSSLSPPPSTVEFSFNLRYNGFCMLGLRLSPWVLVNVPDGASTNKSVLGKQYAENFAYGGTNDSAIFMCPSRWFSCIYAGSSGQLLAYHGTDVY